MREFNENDESELRELFKEKADDILGFYKDLENGEKKA